MADRESTRASSLNGAAHIKSFHGRLRDEGLRLVDNKINEWLEKHPEIEVKFATTTVGMFDGKINRECVVLKMNAAIEKARSSVKAFIDALQSPRAGRSKFSVKAAVTDAKGTEHMWLIPVTFDGKVFHGTINNDVEIVSSVKIRMLRDAMSPRERAEFDKEAPFKID
jgi:hypothetical protein